MNLKDKYELYKQLVTSVQDSDGFIEYRECDSLLWSGLLGCVPGIKVNIDAAFDDMSGQWKRRPLTYPECFDEKYDVSLWTRIKRVLDKLREADPVDVDSAARAFELGGSSISRDMLIGLAWYCYTNDRLDISEQVIEYALTHGLVMGKGSPARTILMPGLLATFAWISYKLGGPSRWWLRWIPADFGSAQEGFAGHLQVMHLLLRKKLTGKTTSKTKKNLC